MSQSGLNASQKEDKESDTFGICFGLFKLLRRDGTLSKHESRDNPCSGSYSAPLNGPVKQLSTAGVSANKSSSANTTDGRPLPPVPPTKVDDFDRSVSHLELLHAHNTLVLLKNSLSLPHLLYIVRTSDYHCHPLLVKFDDMLRTGLSSILNVDFDDTQWLQAILSVKNGGIGFKSAINLAPSEFLTSAVLTQALQQAILPPFYILVADDIRIQVKAAWCARSLLPIPETIVQHIQRAWDAPIVNSVLSTITASAVTDIDHAILKAALAPKSGEWLHTPPIASLGLKFTDDKVRISVAL